MRLIKSLVKILFVVLDYFFMAIDKRFIRRSANLHRVPDFKNRVGGKAAFVEWGHVIGIFQTLINLYNPAGKAPRILDVGCGTGLLAIASQPLLQEGGHYTGIDVSKRDIDFCKQNYQESMFSFQHLNLNNPHYSPQQQQVRVPWTIEDVSFDMVTALSVWTHLNEEDAIFYFQEVARVLKPGGRAIITVFLLDEYYIPDNLQTLSKSSFHTTSPQDWVFDQVSSTSGNWHHPQRAATPEVAISINQAALSTLLESSGLSLIKLYAGNWKEFPGLYFQDILILEKANANT